MKGCLVIGLPYVMNSMMRYHRRISSNLSLFFLFGIFLCLLVVKISKVAFTNEKYAELKAIPSRLFCKPAPQEVKEEVPLDAPAPPLDDAVEDRRVLTEIELDKLLEKNCHANLENIFVKSDNAVLPMKRYKRELAQNFMKKYTNPPNKLNTVFTLSLFKENDTDPTNTVHDHTEKISAAEIKNLIMEDKAARLKLGDDDIMQIPEVRRELSTSKFKVPNIIHFIWFSAHRTFMVHHFMAIIGVLRYQKPAAILFHHDVEPQSEYWEEIKKIAGSTLKLVRRSRATTIFDTAITKVVHQSDVVRLQLMIEVGGIYLDTDSIVLKSVDDFRNYEMVLAQPFRPYSLANGIILANKDAWFLKRWYHEYRYFHGDDWGFNSLQVPGSLAYYFPQKIHVTYTEMCRPNWSETDMIFLDVFDWESIYIMHLYARLLVKKDGIDERPLKQLAVLNTTYGEVARHVIWGDKRIRDVTDWISTCDLHEKLTLVPLSR